VPAASVEAAGSGSESEDDMSKSVWMKSVGTLLAVAALCVAVGGCVSDSEMPLSGATQQSSDSPTMRYYGGPKYPMWSSQ
jgi:hypothetical protein